MDYKFSIFLFLMMFLLSCERERTVDFVPPFIGEVDYILFDFKSNGNHELQHFITAPVFSDVDENKIDESQFIILRGSEIVDTVYCENSDCSSSFEPAVDVEYQICMVGDASIKSRLFKQEKTVDLTEIVYELDDDKIIFFVTMEQLLSPTASIKIYPYYEDEVLDIEFGPIAYTIDSTSYTYRLERKHKLWKYSAALEKLLNYEPQKFLIVIQELSEEYLTHFDKVDRTESSSNFNFATEFSSIENGYGIAGISAQVEAVIEIE